MDGEYQITQFRGGDRTFLPTFSDLALTVDQVFSAGLLLALLLSIALLDGIKGKPVQKDSEESG